MKEVLIETNLPGFPEPRRGKVRDIYDLGERLLIVTTDRISAFDVIMRTGIPDKGKVLNQLAAFWFRYIGEKRGDDVRTHFVTSNWQDIVGFRPDLERHAAQLRGRTMLVKKAVRVLPVEAVVRGYLYGSSWTDYHRTGRCCGIGLAPGLNLADRLEPPIFTPATKAEAGHDENITFGQVVERVGEDLAFRIRKQSLELYGMAVVHARSRGIILADTKLEFGLDNEGSLILIDEAFTPDSSRYWLVTDWEERWPGKPMPCLDKQFLREHLEREIAVGRWSKDSPGPELPSDIVAGIRQRYLDILRMLTGISSVD